MKTRKRTIVVQTPIASSDSPEYNQEIKEVNPKPNMYTPKDPTSVEIGRVFKRFEWGGRASIWDALPSNDEGGKAKKLGYL